MRSDILHSTAKALLPTTPNKSYAPSIRPLRPALSGTETMSPRISVSSIAFQSIRRLPRLLFPGAAMAGCARLHVSSSATTTQQQPEVSEGSDTSRVMSELHALVRPEGRWQLSKDNKGV